MTFATAGTLSYSTTSFDLIKRKGGAASAGGRGGGGRSGPSWGPSRFKTYRDARPYEIYSDSYIYRKGRFNGGSPIPFVSGTPSPAVGPGFLLGPKAGKHRPIFIPGFGLIHSDKLDSSQRKAKNGTYFLYNSTMGVPIIYKRGSKHETNPAVCLCRALLECGCGPLNTTIVNAMPKFLKWTVEKEKKKLLIIDGTLANGTLRVVSSSGIASFGSTSLVLSGLASLLLLL